MASTARLPARTIWAIITLSWAAMEAVCIRKADPAWPPYTHFLREARGSRKNPPFWMLLGLWLWLGFHIFLNESPKAASRG